MKHFIIPYCNKLVFFAVIYFHPGLVFAGKARSLLTMTLRLSYKGHMSEDEMLFGQRYGAIKIT
jgi:hypothetical protein